jgi:hypothetical protein
MSRLCQNPACSGERVRRATRNGRGTKVYLQLEEIAALEEGPMAIRSGEDLETWQEAQRKLGRAKRRIAR